MAAKSRLGIKRVYDPPAKADGLRILVDRLWPRGVSREAAALDAWMPDVAPSAALRKWFGHEPSRWDGFEQRYARELDGKPEVVQALVDRIGRRRAVLLFGARDLEHNQAVVLRAHLQRHFGL